MTIAAGLLLACPAVLRDDARNWWAEGGGPREQMGRALRAVVVERSEEAGRPLYPLSLHLHPIGRSGEDEKKRASPDYENANGHVVDAQRDPSRRTDAAKVATGSSMAQSPSVRAYSG